MSINNWELYSKLQNKKRLTYSKEIVTQEDLSLWGRTKKFFKKLFK